MEISIIINDKPLFTKTNRDERRELDRFIKKLCSNKRLKSFIVFCLACSLFILVPSETAYALDLRRVDEVGRTFLAIIQKVGYWVCLIMAIKEILSEVVKGSTRGIGSIVVKYALAFGTLFALPWIFDLIIEIFA